MGETPVARYTAEFIGTFLLVFTVGCNVLSGTPAWAATSIACVLMVSIYALGPVSGANFNPAVSVTLGLSGKMEWSEVGIYSAIQIIAGIIAGLCYGALFGRVFNLEPQEGFNWLDAGLAEILYTFMLCFVVLNVATAGRNAGNQFFGLAIGFVIIAGGYAAGNISGGAFNPAVAFGIDVSSAGLGFGWSFVYTLYEIIGAGLAAFLFRIVRPDEFDDTLKDKPYPLGPTRLVSEFIGTYFLVLTVGLNVLGKSPGPVWSIAASLMCMIYALGNVSGAHFNPAVTLAIFLGGRSKIPPSEVVPYMAAQVAGGVFAGFTYAIMHGGATFPLEPGKGFGWGHAALAEIVFTFVLCLVVLCVATVKAPSADMFGLAIASCVTAGGYAIGAVSGGSLNPGVSIGISTAHLLNKGFWPNCLLYMLFEFVGAGLAAAVFMACYPDEYKTTEE